MTFEVQKLPYKMEALEPFISRSTMEFHHDKHYGGYVKKLNELIMGTEFEKMDLKEIMMSSHGNHQEIFNNAAQIWNHEFFWQCLNNEKATAPSEDLEKRVNSAFGSFEHLKLKFAESAKELFGSGWTWLVLKSSGEIAIVNTKDAENPLVDGQVPLLTCDIWEHAYYIDVQNERPIYLENFSQIINWNFVEKNLQTANVKGPQNERTHIDVEGRIDN